MNAIEIESTISDDDYAKVLNELYGLVEICGVEFQSGYVLQELDPTAFACALSDYASENVQYKCDKCGEVHDKQFDANDCCTDEQFKHYFKCPDCGHQWHGYSWSQMDDDSCPVCNSLTRVDSYAVSEWVDSNLEYVSITD